MHARLALLAAAFSVLAAAGEARAHGGEIIARAVKGLGGDPVYVDPTAVPTIEPAEADRLRKEIRAAGGRIYVAVLPADAQHELPTARAVAQEIAAGVGGESTFAVLVGGQFRAASVDRPDDVRRLEREAVAEVGAEPSARLVRFVEGVGAARSDGASGGLKAVAGAVAGAAILLALLGLLLLARRRGSLRPRPGRAG